MRRKGKEKYKLDKDLKIRNALIRLDLRLKLLGNA